MRKCIFITILAVFLCFQPYLAADDNEELIISKDKTKHQYSVKADIASNGDVLIVWSEKTNAENTYYRVAYVLCKLETNGSYSVGPQRVFAEQDHHLTVPGLAYNRNRNTWELAWGCTHGPSCSDPGTDIYAAELNANIGIKSSPREIVASGSERNGAPHIRLITKGPNAGKYLMIWTYSRPQSGSKAGLKSMLLDADMEPASNAGFIFSIPYTPDFNGNYYPAVIGDIEQNINGEFLISFSTSIPPEYGNYAHYIARLNANGQLITKTKLGPGYVGYPVHWTRLKKQTFIATYWMIKGNKASYWNRLYSGALKPNGDAYQLLSKRYKEFYSDTVKLENDKGAYTVVVSGGQFWGQYINKKGQPEGNPVLLKKNVGRAFDVFQALCLPGTNRIFLLWQYKYSAHERQVRALVFDAH